ncbi:MAG: SDR family NAD(P)-dependent oxidoreductase, partial [Gemmatimonadales bacterium]
ESAQGMIELNVLSTVQLALAVLPRMVESASGQIVVIGSIAGNLPAQGVAIYAATKAFVESFCRSTYRETRRSGVSVSLIKPGVVKTGFFRTAEMHSGRRTPFARHGVTAERVARRVVGVMARPRRLAYVPFYLRLVPLVEIVFGWLFDLAGPVDLGRRSGPRGPHQDPLPRHQAGPLGEQVPVGHFGAC